jgi:AcrR family transcriptional regulator
MPNSTPPARSASSLGAAAPPPPVEPGLRERKKARLRAQIAEAALALFREVGLERTTVDAICRRIEISQPTFYKYYPSKEAILAEHAVVGWGELLRSALDARGSVEARLRACFATIAARMQEDWRLWHAIAVSGAYNPVRDPALLNSQDSGTRALESLLAQGQERDELTRDFSAERLASMLEGLSLRVGIEWGAGLLGDRPLADAMGDAVEFFLRASSTTSRSRSARSAKPTTRAKPVRRVARRVRR